MKRTDKMTPTQEIENTEFDDHINKCRYCLTKIDEKNKRIILNESHREIFRLIIKVELTTDSNLSAYICENCNEKLKKVSDVDEDRFIEDSENIIKEEIIPYDVIETDDVFYDDIKIEEGQIMSLDMILNSETLKASTRECYVKLKRLNSKDLPDEPESTPIIELTDCFVNLGQRVNVTKEVEIIKYSKQSDNEIPGRITSKAEKFCSCDLCGKKCHSSVVMKGHMIIKHIKMNCFVKSCKSKLTGLELTKFHYSRYHNSDRAVCEDHEIIVFYLLFYFNYYLSKSYFLQAWNRVLQQNTHLWPYKCVEKSCTKTYLTQRQLKYHCFKIHNKVSS